MPASTIAISVLKKLNVDRSSLPRPIADRCVSTSFWIGLLLGRLIKGFAAATRINRNVPTGTRTIPGICLKKNPSPRSTSPALTIA
ncbi:Uncharacterised protein [Mycobacteroides abscessus subsp. abscessus]|nr:Uncharacterised protein [Mycobacteroides abscessus subsp. abscessus]